MLLHGFDEQKSTSKKRIGTCFFLTINRPCSQRKPVKFGGPKTYKYHRLYSIIRFTLTTSRTNLTNTTWWFIRWKWNTCSTIFTCHMRTKWASCYTNKHSFQFISQRDHYLDMYQSLYKKCHQPDTYTYTLSVLHLKLNIVLVDHKAS